MLDLRAPALETPPGVNVPKRNGRRAGKAGRGRGIGYRVVDGLDKWQQWAEGAWGTCMLAFCGVNYVHAPCGP